MFNRFVGDSSASTLIALLEGDNGDCMLVCRWTVVTTFFFFGVQGGRFSLPERLTTTIPTSLDFGTIVSHRSMIEYLFLD
jgi:hypothetical protein